MILLAVVLALACAVLLLAGAELRRNVPALAAVLGILGASAVAYWQRGAPDMQAQPAARPAPTAQSTQQVAAVLSALRTAPDDPLAWMALASAMEAAGRRPDAVTALGVAGKAFPANADLQVLRGEILMRHADGALTPAVRLAFDRAAAIDPNHPAPRYMLALAWVQAGQPQEAKPILDALLASAPADAPWRPQVERLARGVAAMLAAGVGAGVGAARP